MRIAAIWLHLDELTHLASSVYLVQWHLNPLHSNQLP